jgi:hypothetical protein
VLDAGEGREISQEEFAAIKEARDVISYSLATEQKFDIVVENFFEFERELLELSLQHSLNMLRPWESFAHERQQVNRRLGNLTFATTLFRDQMKHVAVKAFGRGSREQSDFLAALEEEKESLPHRTLEVLRDRIQHQSFPEFRMTYQATREGDPREKGSRLHFWFDLTLLVRDLEQGRRSGDPKVEAVLIELRKLGKEIDLLDFVRKHVESIARVIEKFRNLINPRLEAAEQSIGTTIERAYGGGPPNRWNEACGLVWAEVEISALRESIPQVWGRG